MSKLPEFARQRLRQQSAGEHPEVDVLAAFAEQALGGGEREHVLAHLAACQACREVVALAAPEVLPAAAAAPKASAQWLGWPVWRWASVGVAVVIVGSAVMSTNLLRSRMQAPAPAQQVIAMQPATPQDVKVANEAVKPEAAKEQASATLDEGRARRQSTHISRKKAAPGAGEGAAKDAFAFKAPATEAPKREEKSAAVLAGVAPAMTDKPGSLVGGTVTTPASAPPPPAVASQRADTALDKLQVTAAAPRVQKAEDAAAGKMQRAPAVGGPFPAQQVQQAATAPQAQTAEAQSNAVMARKGTAVAPQTTVLFKSAFGPPVRWRVSETGALERLAADGWQPAPVAAGVTFRVVSVVGLEVWAGGNAGALFHSSDSGERWQRVRPRAGDTTLSADITHIEFTDGVHGRITTAGGESWTTADAGRTWTKQ